MGHAGAIVSGGRGGAAEKITLLREVGAHVVADPTALGSRMAEVLAG